MQIGANQILGGYYYKNVGTVMHTEERLGSDGWEGGWGELIWDGKDERPI